MKKILINSESGFNQTRSCSAQKQKRGNFSKKTKPALSFAHFLTTGDPEHGKHFSPKKEKFFSAKFESSPLLAEVLSLFIVILYY